jgi:cytoskeletal protein CcmA (bactofilin family)
MFNSNNKKEQGHTSVASIIAKGTVLKGDITSDGDIRIDGTLQGNIHCTARVVIGANGVVEGDINSDNADIMGLTRGTLNVKDLLQLKGEGKVIGNIHAGRLMVEPNAQFNGQCHMTEKANVQGQVKFSGNSAQKQHAA